MGKKIELVIDFIFFGSKITADGNCSHEIKRRLLLGRQTMTILESILKSRDITLPTKVCRVKTMVFSSSHIWMWELDHKEGWMPKNWCFQIVVWEKIPENPFYCREIKPANPNGNQLWILIGKTDAEAEAPILWLLHVKSQLTGKDTDARKRLKAKGEECGRGWDG